MPESISQETLDQLLRNGPPTPITEFQWDPPINAQQRFIPNPDAEAEPDYAVGRWTEVALTDEEKALRHEWIEWWTKATLFGVKQGYIRHIDRFDLFDNYFYNTYERREVWQEYTPEELEQIRLEQEAALQRAQERQRMARESAERAAATLGDLGESASTAQSRLQEAWRTFNWGPSASSNRSSRIRISTIAPPQPVPPVQEDALRFYFQSDPESTSQ